MGLVDLFQQVGGSGADADRHRGVQVIGELALTDEERRLSSGGGMGGHYRMFVHAAGDRLEEGGCAAAGDVLDWGGMVSE